MHSSTVVHHSVCVCVWFVVSFPLLFWAVFFFLFWGVHGGCFIVVSIPTIVCVWWPIKPLSQ